MMGELHQEDPQIVEYLRERVRAADLDNVGGLDEQFPLDKAILHYCNDSSPLLEDRPSNDSQILKIEQ
jgi:hypothetical protein